VKYTAIHFNIWVKSSILSSLKTVKKVADEALFAKVKSYEKSISIGKNIQF
jgi:hypothetical protein